MSDLKDISYAVGYVQGSQIRGLVAEVDFDGFVAGLRDVYEGKEPAIGGDAMQTIIGGLMQRQQEMEQAAQAAQAAAGGEAGGDADANMATAEEFLAENAKQDGVTTTATGLQYRVTEQGAGAKPTTNDSVRVHYKGTLLDGTEFDSSYGRGQPAEFGVTQVIAGWVEGLQLMNVGSTYEFYIHPDLAYGSRGAGGAIGPNSALIFTVELLDIL